MRSASYENLIAGYLVFLMDLLGIDELELKQVEIRTETVLHTKCNSTGLRAKMNCVTQLSSLNQQMIYL